MAPGAENVNTRRGRFWNITRKDDPGVPYFTNRSAARGSPHAPSALSCNSSPDTATYTCVVATDA